MKGIIYKYTNLVNGKVYIGQTINEYKRREKWGNLNAPYAGIYINRARLKYGISNFEYSVIVEIQEDDETILRELLDIAEKKYIALYRSNEPSFGYNMCEGGNGIGLIVTDESRRNRSKALKGIKKKPFSEQARINISNAHKKPRPWAYKKVVQYDKDGSFIKVWNSLTEVTSHFGDKGVGNLVNAIKRKGRHKYYKGFIWKYYENSYKEGAL